MKIAVFGSKDYGQKNDPEFIAQQLSAECYFWEDLVFDIKPNKIMVTVNGRDVFNGSFDLAICLGWYRSGQYSIYRDLALCMAEIFDSKGIRYWNSEMGLQRSTTKLSQMVKLANHGILVPHTRFSLDLSQTLSGLPDDTPYVAKSTSASRGRNNFLFHNLIEISNSLRQSHDYFLIQEYIPNDHDLRAICFGGEAKLLLKRARTDNSTHLNNTSQGAFSAWIKPIPPQICQLSSQISRLFGREMAGIDFIDTIDNGAQKYYCLEVNVIPQLTSGFDVEQKMTTLSSILNE